MLPRLVLDPLGTSHRPLLLRRYLEAPPEETLVLLPSAARVREFEQAAAEHLPDGCLLGAHIMTFPQFANAILDHAGALVVLMPAAAEGLVLEGVVRELIAAEQLPDLAAALSLRGHLRAVRGLIRELKQAAVPSEEFEARMAAADLRGAERRTRELGRIYRAYQQRLRERQVYDEEGRFWEALERMQARHRAPFGTVSRVLVDGFSDFTATQMDMLHAIGRWEGLSRYDITLTLDPADAERGGHALTSRTRDRLQARFGAELKTEAAPAEDAEATPAGLMALAQAVFAREPVQLGRDVSGCLEVVACPTERGEAEEIARRIKRLLCDEGVKPDAIGVVFRSLRERAGALRTLFDRYGVPAHVDCPLPVLASPAVRFLQRLLALPAGDFARRDLVEVVGSSFFAPTAELALDRGAIRLLEALSREAGIISGGQAWLGGLQRLRGRKAARLAGADVPDGEDDPHAVTRAEVAALDALLQWLPLLLQRLAPRTRTFAGHASWLLKLAEELVPRPDAAGETVTGGGPVGRGLRPAPDPSPDAPSPSAALAARWEDDNACALAAAVEALRAVVALPEARQRMQPGDFAAALEQLWQDVSFQPAQPIGARVQVLDAQRARERRFAHLFVAGLLEGAFPLGGREDTFFPEAERHALSAAGIGLHPQAWQEAAEAYLFHSLLTGATQKLTLLYARGSGSRSQQLPSQYLVEVLRVLGRDGEAAEPARPLPPAPAAAACAQELAQALVPRLFDADDDALAAAYDAGRTVAPDALPLGVEGARVERERESFHPPGAFDGVLTGDEAIEADLRERFGPQTPFTATGLQAYADCPFAFFVGHVLGVAELEEAAPGLDPATEGQLAHRALALYHAPGAGERPLLEECIAGALEWLQHRAGRLPPAMHEVAQARLQRHLTAAIELLDQQWGSIRTVLAEAPFGPPSDVPPVRVGDETSGLLLAGRVDRVDLFEGDVPTFGVLDYKRSLGAVGNRRKGLPPDRDFQLPAYVLAAGREDELRNAACSRWAYCRIRRPVGLAYDGDTADDIRAALRAAEQAMAACAAAIRRGDFCALRRRDPEAAFCGDTSGHRYDVFRAERKGVVE